MDTGMISCVVGDDHALIRKGLVAHLRATPGIQVVGEAADGNAALALIERRRPQAAVLDVHMDGLDGLEICRSVLASGLPTRVVLYTGDDDLGLLDEALLAGARGYVVKTAPLDDIGRAVVSAVSGETFVQPSMVTALLERRSTTQGVLSTREHQVLTLLADGLTTDEIGRTLFLSPATVRTYGENAMHKLGARNRPHLVAMGIRQGLVA